jgi:hypothetical protein
MPLMATGMESAMKMMHSLMILMNLKTQMVMVSAIMLTSHQALQTI